MRASASTEIFDLLPSRIASSNIDSGRKMTASVALTLPSTSGYTGGKGCPPNACRGKKHQATTFGERKHELMEFGDGGVSTHSHGQHEREHAFRQARLTTRTAGDFLHRHGLRSTQDAFHRRPSATCPQPPRPKSCDVTQGHLSSADISPQPTPVSPSIYSAQGPTHSSWSFPRASKSEADRVTSSLSLRCL